MTLAVVTGAGRGIGRAIACALAERGCDVALLARNVGELESTRAAVETLGRRGLVVPCDVSDTSWVSRARDIVETAFGPPSIVVNNAGVVCRKSILEMTDNDWDHVLDTNLKGSFLVTRSFLPKMIAKGAGRFVFISSISATMGTAKQSAYAASKWGQIGFVKSLAEELRETGLQAVSVLPGAVETAMLKGSPFLPQVSAEEVANVVVYAALDAPAGINGSNLEVFGP